MTIRLTKELEQFVQDAVHSGLYAGEEDVILDALTRLRQSIPPATETSVSPEELNRRLLASGLVLQLPDPVEDVDDADDLPLVIRGEPLSETIIRERR